MKLKAEEESWLNTHKILRVVCVIVAT